MAGRNFHVHLVSDSTGETLEIVLVASLYNIKDYSVDTEDA